ncbi:ABC transporter permease [Streptomyces sp. IMTB 2501]|uniref:ABC transporter permease n=1 Tax=Streptomyces sp. IMTB 2501 TaxID=1776340 RepID=UPI0021161BED|nr:ABC transporter permease [Streptomyces sp. IMTB 2501]
MVTAEGREARPVMGVRGRVETAAAFLSALAFVLLLVRPGWIEALLGVDPDQGSGALEAFIAVFALCATVAFSLMARWEWRRRDRAVNTP